MTDRRPNHEADCLISRTIVSRIETVGKESLSDAEKLAVEDALKRGENRTPHQILKDMEHEQASRLTTSQREQISRTLQTASKNEEVLTPQLRDISSASGMSMEGLDRALKGQDSLERKIGGQLPEGGQGTQLPRRPHATGSRGPRH